MSSVFLLGLMGFFLLLQLMEGFHKGEDRTIYTRLSTRRLLDSAAIGLERYKAIHFHYPQCVGKYFLDSIKSLISVSDVYIYADSIGARGLLIPIRKRVGEKVDYINTSHTYFGAGRAELTIVYRPLSMDEYVIYGVGENGLDEGGRGDDVTR